MTIQETAQTIRESRMTQPDQGFGVELMRSLFGQAQRRPNLAIEERGMTLQPIAGHDDVGQSRRQAIHRRKQRSPNGFPFPDDGGVRHLEGVERNLSAIDLSVRLCQVK